MLFRYFQGICRGRTCVATFDRSDMRGLFTSRPVFIAELPLSSCGSSVKPYPIGGDEDSPHVVLTPHLPWILLLFHAYSSVLFFEKLYQAVIGVLLAMAHMKAASSLAIAVTTVLRLLPFAINRRNLAHSLTWHFQAISLTSWLRPSWRLSIGRDIRAG